MKKFIVMPFFCTYLPQYVSFVMPADFCCCLEVQIDLKDIKRLTHVYNIDKVFLSKLET